MQLYLSGRQLQLSTIAACCAWCLLCATPVHGDTLPNAGSLQQSIPTQQAAKPSLTLTSSMPTPAGKAAKSGGAKLVVSRFKWVGNSLYADQVLDSLTSSLLGQSLDFAQLESVATLIANHYRSSGYVVQISLPAQDTVDGVVTIEITEAVFGKVVIDGPSSKRVDVGRIQETILAFQAKGDKLNAHNIDRALAVLSDLAGIRVQGYLMPGAVPGQTDFMVTSQDSPATSFDTFTDNAGARSTGQARVGFNGSLNSPLRMGDQWTFNVLLTSGSDYFRTAYRWPWGHAGVSMGVHASRLNYKTRLTSDTSGVANSLDLTGRADGHGLDAIYPLARRNRYKLDALMGWDLKSYLNQRDQQVDSRYETRALNVGLQGHFSDAFAGAGFSTWQVMGIGGKLQKQVGDVSEGRFHKVKYAFSRTQELTPSISVAASFTGQASRTNLDASEKMYLGGMTGVRAYPSSEVGGSSGQLLNLEMRHRLSQESTWFVFYDHGQVQVNPSSNDVLNQLALQGVGLGYGFVSAHGINLKAILARRLGHHPNPTATGQDQDGSLVNNRFWLSASMPL